MFRLNRATLVFAAAGLLSACSVGVEPSPITYLSASQRAALDKAEGGDEAAVHALFIKSLEPGLDGAASEIHAAELEELLSKMGPDRFWAALRKEPPRVRQAVELRLDPVLRNNPEYYGLYRKLVPPGRRHDAQYDSTHPSSISN